jgi:predicted nucleotidyltransferase
MKNPTQLFYQIMKYPEPTKEVKLFLKWWSDTVSEVIEDKFQHTPEQCDLFSWDEPADERMKEYIAQVQKHAWVWRSLPFVSHIYLANSITFNALHEDSDIDLFIITLPGRLRIARLMSRLNFIFLRSLKIWNENSEKILSFFLCRKEAWKPLWSTIATIGYLLYFLVSSLGTPVYDQCERCWFDLEIQ